MKDSTEQPRNANEKKLTTDDLTATGRGRGTDAIAHPEPRDDAADRGRGRDETDLSPLFSNDEERDFRTRWQEIQIGFVDEPRRSVEQADELIATLLHRLAESFSEQRNRLEQQWEKSDSASTEDLRLALRRYRSFFDRLLSI